MEDILKKKVTRREFLKGLGLLAGILTAISISPDTHKSRTCNDNSYGNSAYGGEKEW